MRLVAQNATQELTSQSEKYKIYEETRQKTNTHPHFPNSGEGTPKNSKESKDTARIISNKPKILEKTLENKKINKKVKISKKNNYRVPVLYPDGKPGMPTTNKRANKWIEEGKAEIVKNKQ